MQQVIAALYILIMHLYWKLLGYYFDKNLHTIQTNKMYDHRIIYLISTHCPDCAAFESDLERIMYYEGLGRQTTHGFRKDIFLHNTMSLLLS